MLPSQALKNNREKIQEILEQHPKMNNLRVFGSVARGEDTEISDLDFLVDADDEATLFDLGGLQFDLQRLLGVKVHLLTEDEIHPDFRKNCLHEAISI
jgi:predicted nucleotidyltransferase